MLALVLVFGAAAGLVAGGRFRNLSNVQFRYGAIAIVLFLIQAALPQATFIGITSTFLRIVWLATFPALIAVSWANRKAPGMALILVGLASNASVIAANGSMPVALGVARTIAGRPVTIPLTDFAHTPLTQITRLPWLADVVATPGPRGIATLISAGDALLFCGAAVFIAMSLASDPVSRKHLPSHAMHR